MFRKKDSDGGSSEHKIRPFKVVELSNLYEIDKRTFNRWLKPFASLIGKPNGQFFTVLQVKKIFLHLGPPDGFDASDYLEA
jgi:hypothetical protein